MRLVSGLLLLVAAVAATPAAHPQQTCATGLCLQQVSCPTPGQTTSISGVVYAPNGRDPLPNVTVYIPNAAVAPFTPGVACPIVGAPPSGSPVAGTTTAFDGSFTIPNVPVGTNIPLVIQVGRWRRQVVVPATTACTDTAFPTRMPQTQAEGDIPKIAVATGSADSVECVLRKIGIADSEFTDATGSGRINLYAGSGSPGAIATAQSTLTQADLMTTPTALNAYDLLMLPCEGGTHPDAKTAPEYANLITFANSGGRVYASHFSYQWMFQNGAFANVANWGGNGAPVSAGASFLEAAVDTTFSEGVTLAQWLQVVGASTTVGQIGVQYVKKDINSINPPTQSYLALDSTGAVQQFVWDTPIAAANQCGRVLFNEYHVENPTIASAGKVFPAECGTNLTMTPQEQLLEFSLFALTAEGNAATLTPLTQDFGTEPINFSTPTQPFTWTNNSTFTASVNLLTTAGDFNIVSNNCTLVAAGASCTINVSFKPTAVGPRTGNLTVGSNGSTLVATLTGNGIPDLVFSLNNLTFPSIDVGQTSTQTFTVSNNASGPVNVPGLVTTGDYSVTNSCGSTVPALGLCTIAVTFQPTAAGPRPGTLAVNSSDPAFTGTNVTLTGNGLDFSVATSPTTGTVIAGFNSGTTFITAPLGGFSANLSLTCSTNAPGSTCTLGSSTYPGGSTANVKVTITTTAQYAVIGYSGFGAGTVPGSPWLSTAWLSLAGFGTGIVLFAGRRRLGTAARGGLLLVLIAATSFTLTGCSGKLPARNANATVPGNYTYTITATDGFLVHSATYALNVTVK